MTRDHHRDQLSTRVVALPCDVIFGCIIKVTSEYATGVWWAFYIRPPIIPAIISCQRLEQNKTKIGSRPLLFRVVIEQDSVMTMLAMAILDSGPLLGGILGH
jgi:hypothetical protein